MTLTCQEQGLDAEVYEIMPTADTVRVGKTNGSTTCTPQSVSFTVFRITGATRETLDITATGTDFALYRVAGNGIRQRVAGSVAISGADVAAAGQIRIDLVRVSSGSAYDDSAVLARCTISAVKDGEDGSNAAFTSVVFKRSDSTPSTPGGGTYANPIPPGWTDAPEDGSEILWVSRAKITPEMTGASDAPSPEWSAPSPCADSTDIEFLWSSYETPGNPTEGIHPYDGPNRNANWNKNSNGAIWMAVSLKNNGAWGKWNVSRVKGDKGADAAVYTLLTSSDVVVRHTNGTFSVKVVTCEKWKSVGSNPPEPTTDGVLYFRAASEGSTGDWQTYTANGVPVRSWLVRIEFGLSFDGGTTFAPTKSVEIVNDGANGQPGYRAPVRARRWSEIARPAASTPSPLPDHTYQSWMFVGTDESDPYTDIIIDDSAANRATYHCKENRFLLSGDTISTLVANGFLEQAADFDFVATDLLMADYAVINFLRGQSICVGSGSDTSGYFGAPTTEGAILYTGADSESDATFIIYSDGKARWGTRNGRRIEFDPLTYEMKMSDDAGAVRFRLTGDKLDTSMITAGGESTALTGTGRFSLTANTSSSNPAVTLLTARAAGNGMVSVSIPAINLYGERGTIDSSKPVASKLGTLTISLKRNGITLDQRKISLHNDGISSAVEPFQLSGSALADSTIAVAAALAAEGIGSGGYVRASITSDTASGRIVYSNVQSVIGTNGIILSSDTDNYVYFLFNESNGLRCRCMSGGTRIFGND